MIMQAFVVTDRTRTPQSKRHVLGRGWWRWGGVIRELVKNKAVYVHFAEANAGSEGTAPCSLNSALDEGERSSKSLSRGPTR